ncbi:outer membrane protein [Rasiella sp. SM2506]|uniref:outer membrane protein n=1 Tax=Rasiella sp. SM2506 TaxID=3423914 RepID=UPI003D7B2E32
MKKIILIATIIFTSLQMQAQEFGLGIHGGYLTEIDAIGAGVDLNYDFNEKWGVSTATVFSAIDDGGIRNKWFAIDLNARYYVVDKLYAFAGGEYLSLTVKSLGLGSGVFLDSEETVKDSEFGVNLGTGYRYNLVDNINLFAEVKYVALDAGYVHAKAGVHFSF